MMKRIHLSLNIEGALQNAADFKGCITVDGKTLRTTKEIKAFFRDQLAQGHRVLPIGECDNFDYQTGCKGHFVPDDQKEDCT